MAIKEVKRWLAKQALNNAPKEPAENLVVSASQEDITPCQNNYFCDSSFSIYNNHKQLVLNTLKDALSINTETGPSLDHLRLVALILADNLFFYNNPIKAGLPDHAEINRQIEKAPTSLELISLLSQMAIVKVLEEFDFNGHTLIANGRAKWVKSRFGIQEKISQVLEIS